MIISLKICLAAFGEAPDQLCSTVSSKSTHTY